MNLNSQENIFPPLPRTGQVGQRPRRVCIASFDFVGPVRNGGVGTAFTSLGEALAEAGHEVTFLYLSGQFCENGRLDEWIAYYRKRGIRFVPMPDVTAPRLEAPFHMAKSYEAYLWLRGENFDVIHFSEWRAPGYYTLLAKHQGLAFADTRMCVHTHGPTLWSRLSNGEYVTQIEDVELDHMERFSVRMADVTVSPSQYLFRWMRQQGWELPEQSFVEQYVQPAAARAKLGEAILPDAPKQQVRELVFFGRLEVRKGLVLFCDALDKLKSDPALGDLKITFLGKITEVHGCEGAAYLRKRAAQWPWRWQVISDRDQPGAIRYLKGGSILAVLPSLADNLPNTVLECLGAQVPFIASNIGGIPEMIAPEDYEAVCFPLRAAAFAEKIKQSVANGVRPVRPAVNAEETRRAWLEWHDDLSAGAGEQVVVSVSLNPSADQPLVSVCISHFNRPDYLRQALASLETQDYPNFEVVLVDDCSTKPEAVAFIDSLAPEFARRGWHMIRNPEELFVGAARNVAARHARGEYLLFMDDDNVARPDEISTFVRVVQKTGADILSCFLNFFSGKDAPRQDSVAQARFLFLGGAAGPSVYRNYLGDTNSLIRREVFLKLGGFHEERGVGHEDWELFGDAVLKGYRMEVVPEALVWYRRNETELSATRTNSLHAGHMRNIRPFLDAVPQPMRVALLLAQGQHMRDHHPDVRDESSGTAQQTIRWRSLYEAGRVLAGLKQNEAAVRTMVDAVKAAEVSKHPIVILEAMLEVGAGLKSLDPRRSRVLLEMALELAGNIKHPAGEAKAKQLLGAGEEPKQIAQPLPAPAHTQQQAAQEIIAPAPILPRVSIVIPTFNNLPLTQNCLKALYETTASVACEIIVVDNASTDGTVEFLRAEEGAGRVQAIFNHQNTGFARACNQGALASLGQHLLFLNNDTVPTAGWLDALLSTAQNSGVGVVGAKLLYPDGRIQHAGIEFINGVPDHVHRHGAADAPEVNQPREFDMVTGACLLVPAALFHKLAGFDEVYKNGVEDVDFCLRARQAGFKVVYEPRATVFHREGQSAGRFDHVTPNLEIFFRRWKGCFDAQHRLKPGPQPKFRRAERSLLTQQPAVKAAWEGSFLDLGSLSHVNRELTRQLTRQPEVVLTCVGQNKLPGGLNKFKFLREAAQRLRAEAPAATKVTVRHGWPPNWNAPQSGAWVLIQPWEFGALPADWVRQLERVDEVWAPSDYVRRVYVDSGVPASKVKVVPNGIDPDRFKPGLPALKLATEKKFKFLFVGGTIARKGPDVLLDAFLQSFTAADDVCLVIKDFGGSDVYAGQTATEQIKAAQNRAGAPEILHLTSDLAPEEVAGLYAACDCLVHPYRGEGFGLPVLEAMACGLPVIVTGGGATDDFATDEFAWRLPASRQTISGTIGGLKLVQPGWWLEPDRAALAQQMRWMIEHRDEARARGLRASEHVRREWTWERAAQIAALRLRALAVRREAEEAGAKARPQRKAAPILLPATALVGQLKEARTHLYSRQFVPAWNVALNAIQERPFHPEAWLLLAEIAQAAGDFGRARECATRARALAPNWKPAQQFLKALPAKSGPASPELPPLPDASRPSPRLSVCLIVKNEEQFLAKCLDSVRPIADQIVVVDTGSTDRTVEIACERGAEVHSFAWCDDFSAARNAALEHARGDWVLVLDADEELPAASLEILKKELLDGQAIAYRLPIVDAGREAEGRSFVPRLFRNAPGLFFVGRVHEQAFSSVEVRRREWGFESRLSAAEILHHGYAAEVQRGRGKIERNLKLLERAVEELPGEPNLLMNYGLELARSGQRRAGLGQYAEAVAAMAALPESDVVPELRETLLTQFATHLLAEKEFDGVARLLQSSLAKASGPTASMHYMLGLAFMELCKYAEAAEQMRQCLATRGRPALAPIHTDIHGAAPHHCRALCLARANQPEGAKESFARGMAENPDSRPLRLDYARFLAEQGDAVEGLKLLHQRVGESPDDAETWLVGGRIALGRPEFLEFACDWTGEAVRHFPEHPQIAAQRGETLLLSQRAEEAAVLWRGLAADANPRHVAASVLCEAVAGGRASLHGAAEVEVSKALIEWYRALLAVGAAPVIQRLNGSLPVLHLVLPTAARLLEQVVIEADKEVAA